MFISFLLLFGIIGQAATNIIDRIILSVKIMDSFSFVLLLALLVAVVILIILQLRKPRLDTNDKNSEFIYKMMTDLRKEVQSSSNSQRKEVQDRLDSMNDGLMKNLRTTSGIVKDVTEKLTKLDETNKQVLNFSEQLQSLENILKNPKQRGILGEYWLETLLGQVLAPGQYQMQYDLGVEESTGSKLIPDAVLFVKEMLIPIDAKFSLENYNRIAKEGMGPEREKLEKEFKSDVKKRIDETSKYIQPSKGTTNFAFMFVPAEGVYHNLITSNVGAVSVNTRNLIEYAFEKGVMVVSPTSFFAYLQTVILGLKALQIEDSVKDIQKQAELLMRHIRAYEESHNKVGKHLETSVRAYSAATKELKKIDKDIYRITDGAAGKELNPAEILDVIKE
jgi:DNA recombination protein RmuC